ncbi:peptidoglycan DD-metalloendopeptidase family protein [Sphingomonas qilianensis]
MAALPVCACIPGGGERPAPPTTPPSDLALRYDPPRDATLPRRAAPNAAPEAAVVSLPSTPPAWQARPVVANARAVAASSYTVRPGDTLRAVAERSGAGSEAIARANALPPPYTIRAGQRLEIPAGRYHLVRVGETGIAIARAYGIDWSRIVSANDLREPYVLRVGMRVLIPGSTPGRTSMEERASAFRLDVGDLVTGSSPAIAVTQRPAKAIASARRVLPATMPVAEPARLSGAFVWPVRGKLVGRFGPGASGQKNNGIKIAVPLDTPIKAAADGIVAYAGEEIAALGGLVILKHGDGWATVYGHASKLLVRRGQAVKRGQTIAQSGETGFAEHPEVHFEMRKGRNPVNPLLQLPGV